LKVFVDTSAILAVLSANDRYHLRAKGVWRDLLTGSDQLICSNYVLLELYTLLQGRFGLDALRLFQNYLLPVLEVVWVDEQLHNQAVSTLLVVNRRNLSLVDCTSFQLMHHLGISGVFAFDAHFKEQGFDVLPSS